MRQSTDNQLNICVINTGGTISCVGNPLAPMTAQDFAETSQRILNPILQTAFPHTTIHYAPSLRFSQSASGTLDSTNLQPSDWCVMAGYILDHYAEFDGFVILHGTDTMDFSGAGLPFLLNVVDQNGFGAAVLSKPVIITGSQVPMYYQGTEGAGLQLKFNTDAYQNFCGAIACARLGLPEVGVYFDSLLFRGSRVLKINASQFRAFDSPNYPPLAKCGIELELAPQYLLPGPVDKTVSLDNPAALAKAQAQLAAIRAGIDTHPVMQFGAFPARYSAADGSALIADLLTACMAKGLKGLVLESYGEGNFPSGNPDAPQKGGICRALKAGADAGLIILNCTQVFAGTVDESAYAAGAWLPKIGALNAADMTPMAGFAKTILLLAAAAHHGWMLADVKRLLQTNLCGEMQSVSRLDSRHNDVLLPGQSIRALDGSASLFNDPKRGPQLICAGGDVLWSPFDNINAGKPGRLIMQNDGNLVLYDDNNTALWATGTTVPSGAASALLLSGSVTGGLSLDVYDYAHGRLEKRLFGSK